MRQLDATTGQLSTTNTTMYALATAPSHGPEAASIISHNGFYYLFLSFDKCCQGVDSTYNTRMGRATAITGPYLDKAGNDMTDGAAEILLQTDGRYIGPGGGTAFQDGSIYYYAYHYYDGDANGSSFLLVRPVLFDTSDWVVLGDPFWQ
jgi:arabinan endo-1,5-alpha-L-arabinosidase